MHTHKYARLIHITMLAGKSSTFTDDKDEDDDKVDTQTNVRTSNIIKTSSEIFAFYFVRTTWMRTTKS